MRLRRELKCSMMLGLAAACALLLASCGKKTESVKETNAAATAASSGTAAEETAEITSAPGTSAETNGESGGGASGASGTGDKGTSTGRTSFGTSISVYEKGDIRIEYPQVSGMADTSNQEKLNEHLKENALAILENYPDSEEPVNQDEDSLQISCEVISADSERVTAVYRGTYNMKGAANPNSIFYTNTVDSSTLKDISLKDVADPYTLAEYALSKDVLLKDADEDLLSSYRDWQESTTVEQYQKCLENADFPLQKSADGKTVIWPDSFSFESEGEIFFSVPVPHAMGDYVIVEYEIETK